MVVIDQEGNPKELWEMRQLNFKTHQSYVTISYSKLLLTITINNQFYTLSYLDNWLILMLDGYDELIVCIFIKC